MLYFAYGSNLNMKEMKYRCPSAKYLGMGIIQGYTLVFRYYLSADESDNSMAVGIWEISNEDEKRLDFYEGYPKLYKKKTVKCYIENGIVEGKIYLMNKNQYPLKKPSDNYLARCIEGYLDCGVDYTQLIDAYNMVK